jgi:hypothetical protein
MPRTKRVKQVQVEAPSSPGASAAAAGVKPATMGEELFLIHLQRNKIPSEDDYDREEGSPSPAKRVRAHSVGEELWEIHLKRSRGMTEEELEHLHLPKPCTRYSLRSHDKK